MKALLIILIIFTILLLLPLGVDGGYSKGNISLLLKIGPMNIRLFPGKLFSFAVKKSKNRKKSQKSSEDSLKKQNNPKKDKNTLNLKEFTGIMSIGLKSLGKLKRHISVDYLRIHYTHASNDPFSTAMGYGYASAFLNAIVPMADGAFNIKERDFRLDLNFFEEHPSVDVWITATIQIWELFYIAIALGIDFLRMRIKQKKKNHTHERTDNNG